MAAKPVVKPHGGHAHCGVCGSCLIAGAEFGHPCRPVEIDPEVIAVFLLETRERPSKSVRPGGHGGAYEEGGFTKYPNKKVSAGLTFSNANPSV